VQLNYRSYAEHRHPGGLTIWTVALSMIALYAANGLAQAVPKAGYVPEGSFQLPGRGQPGAPDDPVALALGNDRTVHIADRHGLVFVFDSTGVYRRSYGEELKDPLAIGITTEGESYVLDGDQHAVYVFGPGGQRLRIIGSKGDRGGQLSDPIDLALGPCGHVYVLDADSRAVDVFSQDGLFVRSVSVALTAQQPMSLAVGNDGRIFVSDRRTPTHIFAFPPFTQIPWVGPTPRSLAGPVTFRGAELREPIATAVNDLGTVVVLDKDAGRLYRANGDQVIGPTDLLYGGAGTGRGSFREAVDIAFAGSDELLILDRRLRKVERIRLTTEGGLARRVDMAFPIRVSQVPTSLASPLLDIGYGPDGSPRFLVETEGRGLTMHTTMAELHATVYGDSVNLYRPDPEGGSRLFRGDIGRVEQAVLTDSSVVVADSRRNRFAVFELESGRLIGTYGDNYQDDRRLRDPKGIGILPDGRVVIADTGNDRVKIFSPDLASLVASFTFSEPAGIAIDPDGEIYVWDETGIQVARLNTAEQTFESMPGGLLPGAVTAITFDQAGNLFALDRATHRITIVAAALTGVLTQLGAEGALGRPTAINVDRGGNIYISDEQSKRTAIYRWDVEFPPLAGFDVDFEPGAAVLSWQSGPSGFIRGYEIQGADSPNGPYHGMFVTPASPFSITTANVPQRPPRYVRVAPVFITGVRGRATNPLPLAYFAADRAYEDHDYAAALQDVTEADRLIESGAMQASSEAHGRLLFIAVASCYAQGDFRNAVDWARKAVPYLDAMPREQRIQYHFITAEVYMRLGDPRAASQQVLALVGQGPRPEYYEDQSVIDQSYRVYRGVRDAGYAEDALEYLRLYWQSIPESIEELKNEYADSVIVFSTRQMLGPGFQYWNEADYGRVVSFFENLLAEGGLHSEQTVVGRQVLACAYFAYGDRVRAEDTFREIFSVRPDFNLDREIPRLRQLYGLRIYNPETQRFFGALRPGS
jgi:DNA-binding beta-propeller fold protein YncE/tetratricopeptide (TPR) repeat protein